MTPGPAAILKKFGALLFSGEMLREMGLTAGRGLVGVFFANVLGLVLGVLAGKFGFLLRLTAPLVSGIQSCPPIVWIAFVMVWAGTGSLVPVATVFAATVPFVFSNTAQGVMGLPRRILQTAKIYDVSPAKVFRLVTLPGIMPFWLAGLSAVLSTAWKAAAVAEYMGSRDGAGAKIYWSYAKLDMESLHAWALALIVFGLLVESLLITPLRDKAARMASRSEACVR
jgi:ABC-type nitrate/sulfonate/bicarbonate transport system permease component